MAEDGKTDGRTDGQRQSYIPPPLAGDNEATGLNGIPSLFVRDGASIIACPFSLVIDLSLIQGVVSGQ